MDTFKNLNGIILYDTGYPNYLRERIKNSHKNIFIMMFYISFDIKKKSSLVNTLVDDLIKAKKRGVSVNVLMDKDKEGDVYNSRIINKNAYDVFKKNKIMVHFDTPVQALHSKVVVIDEQEVIIGSHDWTLNSFFKYNETSIALRSSELADYYIQKYYSRIG